MLFRVGDFGPTSACLHKAHLFTCARTGQDRTYLHRSYVCTAWLFTIRRGLTGWNPPNLRSGLMTFENRFKMTCKYVAVQVRVKAHQQI